MLLWQEYNRYPKLITQLTKCEVLVLDDLLISPISKDDQRELLEIVEERLLNSPSQ